MSPTVRNATLLVATLAAATPASADPAKNTAQPAKKTIVLVHGAFADGSSWDKVVPLLEAKGYNVVAVHQPLSSLADDVAAVKRVIAAQPGEVVLVGHSYGGMVITQAGNDDKVTSLVYVAAFAPDANESITDLGKGAPPPDWQKAMKIEDGYAMLPPETVAKDFAQDVSGPEKKLIAAKEGWIAMKAFTDKPSTAAWKTKPTFYVRTAKDRMIDPAAQEQMATRIRAKTTTVQAGHVAMISKPNEVTAVILEAARKEPEAKTSAQKEPEPPKANEAPKAGTEARKQPTPKTRPPSMR